MFYLVSSLLFLLAGVGLLLLSSRFAEKVSRVVRFGAAVLFLVLSIVCMLFTSIIRAPGDEIGIVRKIYGTKSLPQGHLIATNGETGYQAEIIPPGAFRISLFFNVFNEVTYVPVVNIPQGFYGRVITRDGESLNADEVMAQPWSDKEISKFLDPEYFLTHGGKRGLQETILLPGSYPINLALYNVRIGFRPNGRDVTGGNDAVYDINGLHQENTPLDTSITRIPAGFVGVVRSTITENGKNCHEKVSSTIGDGLVATLVPKGCKGIWDASLPPGDYYLNRDAYDVTLVDTRVQTLEFKGGYVRRYIDLKVDQKGDFTQTERSVEVPFDAAKSADTAVFTKVEGWEVPQELRAVVQIQPEHAPVVVSAVGGLQEVERRIMVPAIRSQVRNVFGANITVPSDDGKSTVSRPTRVLDIVEQRQALEDGILRLVANDGSRAGVDVKEIRLGDSAIPPELLLARQREQLAQQLKRAYEQERLAQVQRQSSEQARATADKQADLVQAEIGVKTAGLAEQRRAAEGRAERAYLEQLAAGQSAQTAVLGQDSVVRLQALEAILNALGKNPNILGSLHLPSTLVVGSNGLEGTAATFGASLMNSMAGSSAKAPSVAATH